MHKWVTTTENSRDDSSSSSIISLTVNYKVKNNDKLIRDKNPSLIITIFYVEVIIELKIKYIKYSLKD